MPLAVTEAEVRSLLSGAAFSKEYGFVLESLADSSCTLRVPFRKEFERPGGVVTGIVFMAAADVAAWVAAMTRLGTAAAAESVTVELSTSFLRAAREEDILCRATIHNFGERLIFGTVACQSESGRLFSRHAITYVAPGGGA